jgi:hypothetical protein
MMVQQTLMRTFRNGDGLQSDKMTGTLLNAEFKATASSGLELL